MDEQNAPSDILQKRFISVADWCKISGIGRRQAYTRISQGKLAAVKDGNRTLIEQSSAENYLAARKAVVIKLRAPRVRNNGVFPADLTTKEKSNPMDMQSSPMSSSDSLQQRFISIEEWCKVSGLGRRQVFERMAQGKIPSIKEGQRTLLEHSSAVAYHAARQAAIIMPYKHGDNYIPCEPVSACDIQPSTPIAVPDIASVVPSAPKHFRIYFASVLHNASLAKKLSSTWPEFNWIARWPQYVDKNPSQSDEFLRIVWQHNIADINTADALLLSITAKEPLFDLAAHVGIALGRGIPVVVAGHQVPIGTWKYHPLVSYVENLEEAKLLLDVLAVEQLAACNTGNK